MILSKTTDTSFKNSKLKLSKDIVAIILSLVFFLTQFYFGSSGKPQYSHYVLMSAIVAYLIQYRFIKLNNTKTLVVFLAYMFINNITWFFINDYSLSYMWSISYWIFNYITLLLLLNLNQYILPQFYKLILKVIFISYLIEIALWMIGLGRYNFQPRYNGYFNDPNQMAFWVLTTSSIYLLLSNNKLFNILVYLMAVFLIIITLSRSAMLGLPFLTLALIYKQDGSMLRKIFFSLLSFITLSVILIFLNQKRLFDDVIKRFTLGIENRESQAQGRGFDIPLENPEHLLFGAGQGAYEIYSPTAHEIHSTWFGILFYYGAVGLLIFITFIYQIFRRLSAPDKLLFIGPLLYGFTTYSARTTIFWFFLAFFITYTRLLPPKPQVKNNHI